MKSPQKRNWQPGEVPEENSHKKQKPNNHNHNDINKKEEIIPLNDDSNIGNESDSDLDYDDLDDIVVPSDNDDFMDDDGVVDEDDKSVHSTATTVSDSSACSNTPSLVGESLETSKEVAKRKLAWVSVKYKSFCFLLNIKGFFHFISISRYLKLWRPLN